MNQATTSPVDVGLTLALAVVTASGAPMLLLDTNAQLLGASDSFYDMFKLDRADTVGRSVYDLDRGRWDLPRLRSLLAAAQSASLPIDTYELDVQTREQGIRKLVLGVRRLPYPGAGADLLLLSIADVTDARLAEKLRDKLIHEKEVLLQEVHHRVANSLQIIASVLMQSARKVQSGEARGYLHDAHHRVMTIAALQKQLAVTNGDQVELKAYLTQLCESIGASMIYDHDKLALTATVDGSSVSANTSVSIGLIVTELVINALKHAFPDHRPGHIAVDYSAAGKNWILTVTDDGVGMPVTSSPTKSGLGTSIVHALAKQLSAQVKVRDAKPGTAVAVVHAEVAAGNGAARPVIAEIAV